MAGGIAHEINNPVCIIKGRASIIRRHLRTLEDPKKEELLRFTESILTTTDRVTTIVNTMKRISRKGQNFTQEFVKINLLEEMDDATSLASMKLQEFDIQLKVDFPQQDILIYAHEGNTSQVILSLISNAIDAIKNKEERWIAISLSQEKNQWLIKVQDSGDGIPLEIKEKIFHPFFTTKPLGEGTGMGLGICRSIITEIGGRLELLKGEENTTFAIALPKEADDGQEKVPSA